MESNTSILDNSKRKEKCQKFTPNEIVAEMLDLAEYAAGKRIFGKKVLEHSFGSGNILSALIEEYILDGFRQGSSIEAIAKSLSQNIFGFELDKKLYRDTIERLQAILEKYKIPEVKWCLYNEDVLFWNGNVEFDYIIGNPPYVTYSEIDRENQLTLRERYNTCSKGKFDYYYAFIELSILKLSPWGKMVQLVPSSIYKNVFATEVRELLKKHIKEIRLFPSQRLFENAETSTSIFLYDSQETGAQVVCENKTTGSRYNIPRELLVNKWPISENVFSGKRVRFGDYFTASNSIATLLNEAFLISEDRISSIEQDVLRPAASPKTLHYQKKQHIIFPYKMIKGKTERFSVDEFETQFPNATKHLKLYAAKLSERKADESVKWFEYGRTQALQRIHQEKLLLSTVVTNSVKVYHLDKEVVPFAGFFITSARKDMELRTAIRVLENKDFLKYVHQVGIPISGSSIRITSKDINEYMLPEGVLYGRAEL